MTHELLDEARASSLKSFTAYCNNSKFREGPQRVSNQLKKDTKHANVTQNSPKCFTKRLKMNLKLIKLDPKVAAGKQKL